MRRLLAVLGALSVLLAGCGSASQEKKPAAPAAPKPKPAAKAPTRTEARCRVVAAPGPRRVGGLHAPRAALDPAKTWTATLRTSCGTIVFELDVKDSPKTSASFASLARKGFYDGLAFHRVAQGFVIQGGDPRGDGSGGPGYQTVEPPPRSARYTRGVVAMAKAQTDPPGGAGSQFFVVAGPDAGLPPEYAVLGNVVAGIGVVERINAIPTNPPGDGAPQDPVVIDSVKIAAR